MHTNRILSSLTVSAALLGLSAGARAADDRVLKLKPVAVHDSNLRQEAVRLLAPADWKISGDAIWRVHPTMPATLWFTAKSPNGIEEIQFLPNRVLVDGVRESAAENARIAGPDAVRFAVSRFPEGGDYMGSEIRRVAATPEEYLKRIVAGNLRPDLRSFEIVDREEMPAWAKTSTIASDGGPFASGSRAGRVRIAYQRDGRKIHEDFFIMLAYVRIGPLTYWGHEICASVRGEERDLPFLRKVFQTMMQSVRIEVQWFSRQVQFAQAVQNVIAFQQAETAKVHDILTRTNNEISAIIRDGFNARQQAQSRSNQAFSQYLRGVEEFRSPQGGTVELPSGYRHVWANRAGEYILTDNPNFDPNRVYIQSTWEEVQRVR